MIKKSFLLLLLLSACTSVHNSPQLKVTEVIDGDTIILSDGRHVRYIGIDTPEVRIRKNNEFVYLPQPFALEAKEFNRKLVEGKTIRLEFDVEKTDKYGRLLAYCFTDETFVNAKLLEEGYAVLYTYPPNVKYSETFVESQKKARQENKGLWKDYETIDSDQAYNYINQLKTVKGKVLTTYDSGKVVYLNFGRNYKTDFTVVIFRNSLKYFNDKGINPAIFYKGKSVEITGRIKEYNGPEIIVNTPAEIEVKD